MDSSFSITRASKLGLIWIQFDERDEIRNLLTGAEKNIFGWLTLDSCSVTSCQALYRECISGSSGITGSKGEWSPE